MKNFDLTSAEILKVSQSLFGRVKNVGGGAILAH